MPSGDGLDFFGSLPGSVARLASRLPFSYVMPKGSTLLDRDGPSRSTTVNLLVQGDPQTIRVTSDRFAAQGVRDFEGQTYQLFQASNLAPGQAWP